MKRIAKILILFIYTFILFGCANETNPDFFLFDNLSIHIEEKKVIVSEEMSGLSFYSTNDAVEINDSGEVVGKKIGSAIVVAYDKKGNSDTCIVVVSREKPVKLEELQITNKLVEANVGVDRQLSYQMHPANADDFELISWSSSDDKIATVNRDGVLKTLSPGTATIYLKAKGTEIVDSFTINVSARESIVNLNYYDVTGHVGTSDLTLKADIITDYLNVEEGVWISNNPEVADVDQDGNVTFKTIGKTEIEYKVKINDEEYVRTCLVTIRDLSNYTIIRTPEQLQEIQNTSGNYCLGNDIDMKEAVSPGGALYHGGAGFSPLFSNPDAAFVGVFDGQGYSIKNIYINSSMNNTALFGFLSVLKGKEGIIKNLALIDGTIIGGNFTSVFAANVGSYTGSSAAGIYNCWTNVDVISSGPASGFVGLNGGTVKDSYTLSKVNGVNSVGAFALRQCDNPEVGIDGCFANSEINPEILELIPANTLIDNASYFNASYLDTETMKQSSTYEGWDTKIWKIEDGAYPVLKTPYYQD